MIKAGFLVNPIAGCGQFLNLKGSDNLTPSTCPRYISIEKAVEFLLEIGNLDVHYYTGSRLMGEEAFRKAGMVNFTVVYSDQGESTSEDTKRMVETLVGMDVEVIIFFGGDGTARDISDSGCNLPVIGVPLGTKMYSSVFALSVQKAADLFTNYVRGNLSDFSPEDVIDLDEEEYSKGNFSVKKHGVLTVPESDFIMNHSKAEYPETSPEGIAEYIVEHMERDTNYLIGPGSTCKTILAEIGETGSLLGFDLAKNGKLIRKDLTEEEIFQIIGEPSKVILSPIGGQGFLIGRGNKQLSGRVISKLGFNNIIVVSGETKLRSLEKLYLDTGGIETEIPAFIRVLFGYGRYRMMPVAS